jgi:putative ABC transport system permease protein
MTLLGAFSALALLLASIGLYGVLSYAVQQRSREIGLRMALGARSGELIGMVLRRGLVLAAIGVVVGLTLGVAAGRALQAILAGISPIDPAVYASAVTLTTLMTLFGCLLPAVRAVRVDPLTAIRSE